MTLKVSVIIGAIVMGLLTSSGAAAASLEMEGIISKDPFLVNGKCIGEYDLSKDKKYCVRAQDVDCNNQPDSPLCTGEKGSNIL